MNREFFNLQLFALNVTVTESNTLVSGTADDDRIQIGEKYSHNAHVTVESSAGNDTIKSYPYYTVIYAGDGNDTIDNGGSFVTIDGGKGDDTINSPQSDESLIYAGDGNDYIYSGSSNFSDNTIDGGAGDDTIVCHTAATINGGAGNDHIHADGRVPIDAGAGDDFISINSNGPIISGTGNDTINFRDNYYDSRVYTITDFDVNDTLHFISPNESGKMPKFAKFANGVLTVSSLYEISLPNVKNINSYRNMAVKWTERDENGEEVIVGKTLGELLDNAPYWKVSGTTATYYAADGSVILTLTGLKSGLKAVNGEIAGIDFTYDSNVSPYWFVTLSKDVLDKKTVSLNNQKVNDGYGLIMGNTVPVAEFERTDDGFQTAWSISGITATLKAKCTTAGYYIDGDKIKYCAKDAALTLATINGIKSGTKVNSDGSITGISVYYWNDGSYIYGDVTFSDSAPISDKVTVDSDEISFNFSSEDENGKPNLFNNHTVTGGANDDHIDFYGANNVVNTGAGNDNIYVGRNFLGAEYASNNNTVIAGVGNDVVRFNGSGNYVDAGTGDDTISAHSGWDWDKYDEKTGTYPRLSISNDTINAGADDDLISTTDAEITSAVINAGAGNDTIEMAKATSNVIDAGDGNDYISVLGDYSEDWDNEGNYKPIYNLNANDNTISGGKGDDTIHIGGKNNVVQYASGDDNDTIFGYNSDDTLQIAGSYTTQKSGSDLIVKVGTGAITLKDVNKANIETVAGHIVWTASGTTATGKIDGKIVATITGLKKGFKADSISDSGSVISISQDALGTAAVKLTKGDYTLALANDVEESVKTLAHWNVDGSSATYRSLDITKGYTVATNGKSITYVSKATVGKDLTTVEGLSENVTADDLTLKGKVVTVKANALGTDEATISNGYTFKLDTDVTKSVTTKASWAIDDDSAEYTTAKVTEGYVLSKDKKSITHNEAGGGEMVATIDGLKKGTKANAFSVKNNVITVAKTALNPKNIITLDSEDYTLAIGGGVKKSVTSPEGWYISGTTASYNTEKTTAGYALFDDSKTVEYISEVDGGDTLVKLTGLKARTKATSLSIKNKVVTIDEDAINVKSAMTATAEGYEIKLSSAGKITAKSENMTLTGSSGNDTLLGSKYADVLKGGTGEDYLSGGNGADKIYGDGDDTLIGGLGKDSLYSTAGDNTLTGGSGADEFYFKAGNAIITDYTAGTDKIYLQGTSITKTEVSGKNVVFSTDNGGTITVKNGKNKKITVDDVTQKYSASSSGLFAEDNFVTADNLSQLVENNSVGEFEFNSSENLTQENLITFAEK